MLNNSLNKVDMPMIAHEQTVDSFDEIFLGYTIEQAELEAKRCINCKTTPCVYSCPANVPIPEFIQCILEKDYVKAYEKIAHKSSMPDICSRVCPKERQCEKKCIRAIKGESVAISNLERFVIDMYYSTSAPFKPSVVKNNIKVAVIGSGPAGLSCAYYLALRGYDITIFDSHTTAGGVLSYGIPSFRLPNNVLNRNIQKLVDLSVKFEFNKTIGKDIMLDELFQQGFKSIFIGCGLMSPNMMDIPGEDLDGIFNAYEFLKQNNHGEFNSFFKTVKKVAIIGGGNVAIDAARCSARMSLDSVDIIYRRTEVEMPAYDPEIEHAKLEGVTINTLVNPVKVIGKNGRVIGLECVKMQTQGFDSSGRVSVKPIEDSNFIFECDAVVMAIGNSSDKDNLNSILGLELNRWGNIVVDNNHMTSIKGVYAGGDIINGAETVVLSMRDGREAAESIDKALSLN